jgi:hypothetical protein
MLTPATMIEKYIALRNKVDQIKSKHADELAPYTNTMQAIENELLRHLEETKLDSIKGDRGTAYKQTATSVTVKDWATTLAWIREQEAWDLLEARVAKTAAVTTIEEMKKPIPGVQITRAVVLRVRTS